MDELLKQILTQSPLAAVLLFALWRVYSDLKANQEIARQERKELIDMAFDLKNRVESIEISTTGERSPTLAKRP